MAKEKVKQMTGVFASVFAHAGHIYKEDSREISGLDEASFEKACGKASNIAENLMKTEGKKTDKFLEHFAEEIDEYTAHFGGKLFEEVLSIEAYSVRWAQEGKKGRCYPHLPSHSCDFATLHLLAKLDIACLPSTSQV